VKLDSIIKKAEGLYKKIDSVLHRKTKSTAPDLLIPGDDYMKLKSRYYSYKNLLLKNNELLDALSEVDEGIESKTLTLPAFRSHLARIFNTTFEFIQSLNDMTDSRYMYLYDIMDRIKLAAGAQMKEEPEETQGGFIIPIEKITVEHLKNTGGKAAPLGEIRNKIKLPAPSGFSITVSAYKEFMSLNNLEERVNSLLDTLKASDSDRIEKASKAIRELVMNSSVPPSIEEWIYKEIDRIGKEKCFSVRSSAVGEDSKLSFAGQFRSVLNVKRDDVIQAYKEVIASKYDIRAIFYRLAKGIRDRDMPMAVFVLEMVDARSSGVLYTLNPGYPEKDETMLSSVWGQGQYAVGGTVSPDMFILDRRERGKIIDRTIPEKNVKLALKPSGGVEEVPVPQEDRNKPTISDEEIRMLYHYSVLIERHFGTPQDIEWSIDNEMRLLILQARPLNIRRVVTVSVPDTFGEEDRIISEGETSGRGAASGPVFIVDSFDQIQEFPEGAVLVAKNTSNEYARIMKSASAIVIGTGSRTSHLATVAREFNVPMLINAGDVTETLRNEGVVTVDANTGHVYRGRIHKLLKTKAEQEAAEESLPHEKVIRNVMKSITPLNLIKIDEAEISTKDFQTIHDIIRYVHEVSVKEMFRIGELTEGEGSTQQLTSKLIPMYFYIIDLDGGIADEARFLRKISPEHLNSIPFKALWRGMTYEGVRWSGAVDIDMGGLASVMARSFVRTGVEEKGGKGYVILTDQYVNMSVKLAYHFTVFDAFCGESYINNYINFRFQGGGASAEGRYRRALFIREILESYDFRVEVKGDMVIADMKGASQKETEHRLDILGRLLGCSRQLDMAISSMEAKDWYVKAFMEGNYSFVHD
jgi:pyruvate,water dikinase